MCDFLSLCWRQNLLNLYSFIIVFKWLDNRINKESNVQLNATKEKCVIVNICFLHCLMVHTINQHKDINSIFYKALIVKRVSKLTRFIKYSDDLNATDFSTFQIIEASAKTGGIVLSADPPPCICSSGDNVEFRAPALHLHLFILNISTALLSWNSCDAHSTHSYLSYALNDRKIRWALVLAFEGCRIHTRWSRWVICGWKVHN